MAKTRDALAYLVLNATTTVPPTLLKLTTLLYLSDWRSAITLKRQITDIKWIQPFVAKASEVGQYLGKNPADFTIATTNQLEVAFVGDPQSIRLPLEERACLDFVLQSYAQKDWPDLFRLAYSTYPMFSQAAQSALDLVALADMYEHSQSTEVAG